MKRIALYILLFASSIPTFASIEALQFDNQDQQKRYQGIIAELRCLVCQNQNLADSDAELAKDLRSKTYDMIVNGNSDSEIYEFMQSRYGDFVLYNPPLNTKTWLLWFGPFVLLLIAISVAVQSIRKRARFEEMIQTNRQNQSDRLRVQSLLRDTPSLTTNQKKKDKANS